MTIDLRDAFSACWVQGVAAARSGVAWSGASVTLSLALFFDLDAWRPWLPQALTLLDATERGRVQRKHRPADRDDLALTYALHRLALGAALAREPASIRLSRTEAGRPYLFSDAVQTSLSHADGHAAVAIVGHGPVGIDLERAARAADMPAIAAHVCHPAEARALAGLAKDRVGQALLQIWVCKEALLKAAGIGLAREMWTLQAPTDRRVPLPRVSGEDDAQRVTVRLLDVGPAFVAGHASGLDQTPHVAWLAPPR